MYDGMINAFNKAINRLREEEQTTAWPSFGTSKRTSLHYIRVTSNLLY